MINLIFDKDLFKIMTIFSISSGSRFRRKELKEKTRLNNVPLDISLKKLIKTDLLKKERNLYSINFENQNIKIILDIISKQYKSLKEIPSDVYFLLNDLIFEIGSYDLEIYLFGSYSKLVYKEDSDIDIAILGDTIDKAIINKVVRKLENRYKKNIEIHYFDKNLFYKNKKDPLVEDIIKNGIRLF